MTDDSRGSTRFSDTAAIVAANASSALALSAIFAVMMCRLAIWFPPTMATFWTMRDFWLALASTFQDTCVLLVLICLHWVARAAGGRGMGKRRTIIDAIFAILYFAFIAVITSNVVSIHSIGAVLDLNWFGQVNPSNSSTIMTILTSIMTRSKVILIIICLIVVPLVALMLHRLIGKDVKAYAMFAAAIALTTGGMSVALPAPADSFSRTYKTRSPIAGALNNALFPSAKQRLLAGEPGVDPQAEAQIGERDWRATPHPAVDACCTGMNIVLITLDSVPLKRMSRDYVLKRRDQYPNLAQLYRRSIAYDNFYTNYPSSTEALRVMLGSVYASNEPLTNSMKEWVGRDVPTLPAVLAANGYSAAHFMSGELAYDNVNDFLKGRGFSKIEDSYSLSCGPNDDALRAIYTHVGDDCIANAAARWVDAAPPSPFFLWVWLTNPHTPYFINRQPLDGTQGRSADRHAEAVRETDAAIGKVLRSLEARNLMDNTVIILMADHGEAFGEHGLFYHGTSLHDEQVRIPMLVSAPALANDVVANTLGSTIDLAPTITGLLGLPTPAEWQGQSLFAEKRKPRVYFTALSAGRMAGYREGNRKYILSSLEDQPFAYDLVKDPAEQNPIALPPMERRVVAARLGAFVRDRNAMRWTKRQVVVRPLSLVKQVTVLR
jgi:lipoteichoic acid synthase